VLKAGKEPSCPPKMSVNSVTELVHAFNINLKINDLIVNHLLVTGQLETGKKHHLDYDNMLPPNEKYGSKKTYKNTNGYQPGIANIGNLPVYIERGNGSSQAKYPQIKPSAGPLRYLDPIISIGRFRGDSASSQQSVIKEVAKNADSFYSRVQRCAAMEERIMGLSGWQKIRPS